MTVEQLISPAYRDEQIRLHSQPRGYGQRGRKWASEVMSIGWVYECPSVLDYACGAGSLCESLRHAKAAGAGRFTDIREYDPAVPGKDALPSPADLVVATDVLEHVEADKMWAVLEHLASLTQKACFVVVSLVETAKTLSDGSQAHISLHSREWWKSSLEAHGFIVARELDIKPEKQWCAVLVKERR